MDQIFGGDGGFCAADQTDPKTFYGEYVFLNIHRNIDEATTDDTTGDRYISGQFFNHVTGGGTGSRCRSGSRTR